MIDRRRFALATALACVCAGVASGYFLSSSHAESPAPPAPAPRYLAAVLETSPVTVHFSLGNPGDASAPMRVPRPLEPVGAFVSLTVRGADGAVACETRRPKFKAKLHPARDESYVELAPGYTHGAVLVLDGCKLARGAYRLDLAYSNLSYRGSRAHPIGDLAHRVTLPLVVD